MCSFTRLNRLKYRTRNSRKEFKNTEDKKKKLFIRTEKKKKKTPSSVCNTEVVLAGTATRDYRLQ